MALRHPWFSQTLKRKCPDDLLSSETSTGFSGGGFGVVGTVYGGLSTNACHLAQVSQPNQTPDSNPNGRATKRFRKFESRNLERGFAELSIQPTSLTSPPPTHIQQHHLEPLPETQTGGHGIWINNVVGSVGQSSNVLYPNGSTIRPSSVDEPSSFEVDDVQMSTSSWYEPEKDRIIITSLDDDEYDGDDEGRQQPRTEAKSTAQESEFTISPAFLNAIMKLRRPADPPTPSAPTSQALVLFRPPPPIAPPPANDDRKDPSSFKEGILDSLVPQPPPFTPLGSSPFYVQDPGHFSFVSNEDDMEIEML